MDATAINAIRDLSTAAISNDSIAIIGLAPTILLPDGYKLQALEQYQPQPDRFRGTFSTRIIDEFISYINDHADSHSSVFIDPVSMSASAILDMGDKDDPHWGQHKTSLALKRLPDFNQLIQIDGLSLSQQAFIDFAEDWEVSIQFFDDAQNNMDFKRAINAIRRITVSATSSQDSEVNQFNRQHSAMDAIEVSSKNAVLPTGFTFDCMPYEGFDWTKFVCQLRPSTSNKLPELKYRIIGLDNEINRLAKQFKDILHKHITADEISLYTGTMTYQK